MNQSALAHSCTYQSPTGGVASDPAPRMAAFFDLFAERATFASICTSDFSPAVDQIGRLATFAMGSPCVTRPLGTIDCIAEDVVGATTTAIPPCGTAPCWRLDTDAAACPAADHLKLVVVRDGTPDPSTVTNLRCTVPAR